MSTEVATSLITGVVGIAGISATLLGSHLQTRRQQLNARRDERRQVYFEILQRLQDVELGMQPLGLDVTVPSPERSVWVTEMRDKVQLALDSTLKAHLVSPYLVAHYAEETARRMLDRMFASIEGRDDQPDEPFWDALLDAMREDLGTEADENNITKAERRTLESLYGTAP